MKVLYCTPEMRIGKHWWRCQVEESTEYGAVWMYQWRRDTSEYGDGLPGRWRPMEEWHSYNSNASDDGLPKTVEKLYRQHEWEIWNVTIQGKEKWLAENQNGPYAWRWENERKELERDKERFARMAPPKPAKPVSAEAPLFQEQKG